MKITKENEEIVIRIPFWSKRINPYMEDEDVGEHQTLTGLIIRHRKDGNYYDEIGFAYLIDRDYKGKCDDIGPWAVMWYNEEKEFIDKCKELGLSINYLDF